MNKLIAIFSFLAFILTADTVDIITDAQAPAGSGGFTYLASWFNRKAAIHDNGDVLFIRKHDFNATSYTAVYRWSPDNTFAAVYNGYDVVPILGAVARPAWQVTAIDSTRAAVLLYNENKPAIATIGSQLKCSLVKDLVPETNLQDASLTAAPNALRLYTAVPNYGLFTLTTDNDAKSWTEQNINLNDLPLHSFDIAADKAGNLYGFITDETNAVWLSRYCPADKSITALFKAAESTNHNFAVAVSEDGSILYFTAAINANDAPAIYRGTYNATTRACVANAITPSLGESISLECSADGTDAVFSSVVSPLDGTDCGTPQIWLYTSEDCAFSCLSQHIAASATVSCSAPAMSRNARIVTFTAETGLRQQPQLCRIIRDLAVTVPDISIAPASTKDITISANHLGENALLKASATTGTLLLNGKSIPPNQTISFQNNLTFTYIAEATPAAGTLTVRVSEDNGATWHTATAAITVSDIIFEVLSVHENGSLLSAEETAPFLSVACNDDTSITAFTTSAHLAQSDINVSTNIYVRNTLLKTTTYRSDLGNAQFCAISPDGSTVVRSSLQGTALNFDGSITKTQTVALSRDGTFAITFKTNDGLYLSRNNEPVERILKTAVQPAHIAFSLSGTDLFYCLDGHPSRLHLATGDVTMLADSVYDDAIVSADGCYLFTLSNGVITRHDLTNHQSLLIYTALQPEQTGIVAAAADGSSLVFVTTDAIVPEDTNHATDIIRAVLPIDKVPVGFETVTAQEDTAAILPLTRTCPQDLFLRCTSSSHHGTAKLAMSDNGWYGLDYLPSAHYWGDDTATLQAWNGSEWQTVTVDIAIETINDAPQWLQDHADITVAENKTAKLALAPFAYDQDLQPPVVAHETLSYSLKDGSPQWATISAAGTVTLNLKDIYGLATRQAPATITITAIVTDSEGASAELPVIVTVTNTDPVIKQSDIYTGLKKGWNLVAYPVDLPTADYFSCAWRWNTTTGRFEQADIMEADRGHFVYLSEVPEIQKDKTIVCDYTGTSATEPGWHLVGHRAGTAHWSIAPKAMVYQSITGALLSGKGYWKYVPRQ